MRKILTLLGVLFISFFLNQEMASANDKQRDDYTFGEIEEILLNYINEEGKNIKLGSEEYNQFIIDQNLNDTDQKLSKRDDYHLISAYFGEYLYRLSLHETNTSSDSSYLLLNNNEYFELDDSVKSTTLGEMKIEITKEEMEHTKKLMSVTPQATGTINITNARNYASKYYKNYNRNYPSYTLDCTNFVSQILFAGGRKMVTSIDYPKLTTNTKYWFIKKRPDNSWSRSTSWTVVEDLYSHLIRTQTAYSSTSKTSIISNAKAGDVIQFKKAGSDRYSHSMWVYEKQSDNLLLSGHTSDYLKRSFKAITGWERYRVIKM